MLTTRQAIFLPESADKENRTIEVIWSTGAPVLRNLNGKQYFEELDLKGANIDRFNKGAPVLNAHRSRSLKDQLGVVEKAWVDDGKGKAKIRFSSREDVAPVFKDVIEGIIRNVSIGYKVIKQEVEERKNSPSLIKVQAFEVYELSFVPIPADGEAQTRSNNEVPEQSIAEERERILGIMDLRGDAKITRELIEKGNSVGDAAIEIRRDEINNSSAYLTQLKKSEVSLADIKEMRKEDDSVSSILKLATRYGV